MAKYELVLNDKTAYTKRITSHWVCIKAEETTQIIEEYKLERVK